jgi:hypothetical protein
LSRVVTCPYCSRPTEYVDSIAVYRKSYGMIYLCRPCEAWVGVHKGTNEPLGRLANKELREWKMKAHAAFDPLWQRKLAIRRKQRGTGYKKAFARGSGYRWLSEQLGIPREACHIGMFDVATCKRVVELCEPHLRKIAA